MRYYIILFFFLLPLAYCEKSSSPKVPELEIVLSTEKVIQVSPDISKEELEYCSEIINSSKERFNIKSYGYNSGTIYLSGNNNFTNLFTFNKLTIDDFKKIKSLDDFNNLRNSLPKTFMYGTSPDGVVFNSWNIFNTDKENNWVFRKIVAFNSPKKEKQLLYIYVLKDSKKESEIPEKIRTRLSNMIKLYS